MSQRVMNILSRFTPDLEVYSIDEAFLEIDSLAVAEEIRRVILQWTGLPVSLGIASTKTLAKVASSCAKKGNGIYYLEHPQPILEALPVEDVWGIGRKTADFLHRQNLHTAWELASQNDLWIKKNLTVRGLRMAYELRGIPSLSLDELPSDQKSILRSRSFGRPVSTLEELLEAIAAYTTVAAEEVRLLGKKVGCLDVFLHTHPHKAGDYYSNSAHFTFPEPTAYTPTLITAAKESLRSIYKPHLLYKKTGIIFSHLVPETSFQTDFFAPPSSKNSPLMDVLDRINRTYGDKTLRFAAEGIAQPWKMKSEGRSPRYTTNWHELLTVR